MPGVAPALDRQAGQDKVQARRRELAQAALQTLGEVGYAQTSLRTIAERTPFSHGVLHYYFRDKLELVSLGVRQYKETCVTRYDEIVAGSNSAAQLRADFADALVETMTSDTAMHRLWYDLRSQAMFEPQLQADVLAINSALEMMIWAVVQRFGELSGRRILATSSLCYSAFDGVFENCLLAHLDADPTAAGRLREQAVDLLDLLVGDRR